MVRTVDVTAPFLLRWLIEPRQVVAGYGRTKGEVETAVKAFSGSLGGPRRIGQNPLWAKLGLGLSMLAFLVASSSVEPPYRTYAIAAAVVLFVAAVMLTNRTLFLPAGIASGRSPLKGRLSYYGGGALLVLGFATCFVAILSMQGAASWSGMAVFLAGMVAAGAGALVLQRGKKILQPTASELQAHDTRRPIVLLRSFADDDLVVVTGRSKEDGVSTADFEESIEEQLAPFGPFVAVGKPGEALPTLGAARNYYSDDQWQEAVAKWMDEALLLVVIPGMTGGLGWELDTIRKFQHLDKLLVLMPPRISASRPQGWTWAGYSASYSFEGGRWQRDDAVDAEQAEAMEKRWDKFRGAFAGIETFAGLPEDEPQGLIAMHLHDGDVVLLTGPDVPWASDYERAIHFAIYGMLCHRKTLEQGAVPLSGAPAPGLAKD